MCCTTQAHGFLLTQWSIITETFSDGRRMKRWADLGRD